MSTLILDNFTGTNGTDLTAHTISPTNTPSTSWTNGLGGAAAYTIQSNRAVAFGLQGMIDLVNAGAADVTISATVRCVNAAAEAGLTFRWQDSSNYWFVTGYAGDGKSYLYKVSGGSVTNPTSGGSGVTSGVDFVLQVVLSGSSITVNINGVQAYTASTGGFLDTATMHGLDNNSAHANQFDDFQIDGGGGGTSVIPLASYYNQLLGA